MHISSLPGHPYTGNIGTPAKKFADFLKQGKQSVWQVLPVHPTTAGQGYSPYSSSSVMAANPLFISPEWLVSKNLLAERDLLNNDGVELNADFDKASIYVDRLLNKAWLKWKSLNDSKSDIDFRNFCSAEAYWLTDFSLYTALKSFFNQSPWYEWPSPFRDRNADALRKFEEENEDTVSKIRWTQMIFHQQWQELRSYCNERGIQLMGDIPIYVAHDSADVWSNREIFTLKSDGALKEVSGVPPDLFNDNGQLWGTPLFEWNVLKKVGYKWWIDRFKRNIELFDLLRLDHFRGFSDYWAVAATEKNAKKGRWKRGPGSALFSVVTNALGKLPLIAEDLGDINADVYALRDKLNLPGMNVLQFAFIGDLRDNQYLPHHHVTNSLVYTGTHDNDTSKGWFGTLLPEEKVKLSEYTGRKIDDGNVSEELCRLAYMSVSRLAVLPLQDILSLDESCRMNMPATASGNWTWRVDSGMLNSALEKKLSHWVELYARAPQSK